jgi:hypothetical protein
MNTVEIMIEFFGWCSIINIGILFLSALTVIVFREPVLRIHRKVYHVEDEVLLKIYLQYLALYKILIIIFSIVPYFALKLLL